MTNKTRRTLRFLWGVPEGQEANCGPWLPPRDKEPERLLAKGCRLDPISLSRAVAWAPPFIASGLKW